MRSAVNCYDIARLLGHSAEKNHSSAELINYLKTVKDFKGAGGTFSATGDNRFTLPAVVKVVTEDGFRELS